MTIKWMQHPKHGKFPCTSADVDMYRKAGWTDFVKEPKTVADDVDADILKRIEEEEAAFDPNAIVMSPDEDLETEALTPKSPFAGKKKSKGKK